MAEQTLDLETMPMEQLAALAQKEADDAAAAAKAGAKPNTEEKKDQPRGEDGKFKPTKEVTPEVKDDQKQDEDDEETTVYRRVIDLGDGAGPEVFEAESLEELVDKISDAKGNATKKIRQQEAELRDLRARTAEKPAPKEVSKDTEYVISQEMLKNPTKAIKIAFKELTGRDIEEFGTIASREEVFQKAEATNNALATFLTTHPDYKDSPKNSAVMKLALQGKTVSSEELHKAYLHCTKSGLLEVQGEEAHANTDAKTEEKGGLPKTKVETTQTRTRKGSGVSTQSRTATPKPTAELSEDEIAKLSDDQLRDLANKELAAKSSS